MPITTVEPDVVPGGRYPMGEAARLLGVNRCTLREYIERGLIKTGIRRSNGRRFIEGRELRRFWLARW